MSDLVVHYTFEPSTISGTTLSNAAYGAKTIDGTITSATTSTTIYKIGSQSVGFDGNAAIISIPTIASSSESWPNVTLSFWVYRTTTQPVSRVVSQIRTSSQFFNVQIVANSNNLNFITGGVTYTHTSANVFPNNWHHIVWVISSNIWKIYVNNVKVEFTNSVVLSSAITRANIGSDSGTVSFTGNIDDWRLYKTALSDDQIYEIFDRASYTHYYRFESEDVTTNTLANLASGIPVFDSVIASATAPNNFTSNSFKIDTTVYKSGTSSLYSNGTTNNYVALPAINNIDPSGITISIWYNPSSGSTTRSLFTLSSSPHYWQIQYNQSTSRIGFYLNRFPPTVSVVNGFFTTPNITTGTFTYINSPYTEITGWSISGNSGIIIIDNNSVFGRPTLPVGVSQILGIQNGTSTTISQSFTLEQGIYNIGFYIAGRSGTNLYNTNQRIGVTFGGVSIAAASSVSTVSWYNGIISVTVSAAGSYTLTFTVTCSVTGIDTTLYLAGVSITNVNTTLGAIEAQNGTPNGSKIGSDKSAVILRYGASISQNAWQHIVWRITPTYWAITINGSTTKLYSGSNMLSTSYRMSDALIAMPTSASVTLLQGILLSTSFAGYLDDFRVYNRVLSDAEVDRLYTYRCLRTNYYDKYGNDFIRLFQPGTSGLSLSYESETNDNITGIFGLYSASLSNSRLTSSYVLYNSTTLHLVDSISGSTVKPITRILPGQLVSSAVITTSPYVVSVDVSNNTVILNKPSGGSAQSVSGQSVAGYYYVTNGIAVLSVNPSTSQSFTGTAPAVGNMLYHTNIPIGTYIKSIYEPNLEDFTIPVLTNESFSVPALSANSSSSISSPYSSITGWTISGTPEIFIMNKTSPFGVATPPSTVTQWIAVKTTVSGQIVTITQPVTVSTTGTFILSFDTVVSSTSSTSNTINASIGGYSTSAFYPGNNSWITRTLRPVFLVAGTYTLTFTITTGENVTSYLYFTNVLFSNDTRDRSNTVTSSLPTSFLLSNTNINIPVTTTETMKWYAHYTNANFYSLRDITENLGYNLFSGTSGFDDFIYKFSNFKNTTVPYIATGTFSVTNHANGFYTIQFTDYGTIQFVDGVTTIQLLVVGSGGGGGSSVLSNTIYYGGGGGGGGQVRYFSSYRINTRAVYTVDIGIGGETSAGATGGRGAPCLFGDIVSFGGNGGGITTTSTGGTGGTGGGNGGNGGTVSLQIGTNGSNGSSITFGAASVTVYGGGGAGGKYGIFTAGNASGGQGGGGSNGSAGTNELGGGGSGAHASTSNTAGGAGGKGVVLIYVGLAPDAPTGLVSTTKTNTTIAISFNSPARLATDYTVTAQPTSGSTITATFTSGTTYTITGLTQNTAYSISMTASNRVGVSPVSNIITVTTLKTNSDAPTIGLLNSDNNVLKITFGTSEQEMTSISTYAVQVESPFTASHTYKTTNYLAKIPGLIRNTFYRVYAIGTGSFGITPSSVTTFKTRNIPDPISSLALVSRASSNLVVSFNRPTTNDGGVSPILYYTFNEGTYNGVSVGNLSSGVLEYDGILSTGTINTAQYKYGNSSLYNTNRNGVPFQINKSINLATTNYLTISMWMYPTRYFAGTSAADPLWFYSFNNTTVVYAGMLYAVRFESNGTQRIICGNNNYYTNTVIPLNTWTHVVYVQQFSNTNTSSNTLQVYINGTLQQTITGMNTYNANMIASTNYIGSQNDGTAYYDGWIDDFRVYNQQLSQSQIEKVRDNNLPLNASLSQYNLYTKSLYYYDKTSMIGLYQIIPYNIVSQNILYNYAYSSLVLDASLVNLPLLTKVRNTYEITLSSIYSQHIKLPNITLDTNGFTFACWFRSNNTSTWGRLLDLGTFNTLANSVFVAVSSNVLKFGFYNSGGGNMTGDVTISSTNVNTNTYHHLVFIISARSGTTCTVSAYLNGSLAYNASNISYPIITTRTSCFIGRSNYTADPYLNGGIFDIFLWQRPISGSEAAYLYNNPSTVSYETISDTTSSTITRTISGLQSGEKYTLAISSANSDGEAYSIPILATTLLIPSTPTNFSVSSITDVSAVFQFTAPSEPVDYYNLQLYTNSITTVGVSLSVTNTFTSTLPDQNIRFGYNTISVTSPGANRILLVTYGYDYGITGFVRYFIVNDTFLTSFDLISVTVTSVSNYVITSGVISNDGTRIVAVVYSDSNVYRIFYGDATAITANTSNSLTLNQIEDNASVFMYDSISLSIDGYIMVTTRTNATTGYGVICFSIWNGTNYGPLIPILDTTPKLLSSVAVSGDGSRIVYVCMDDAIYWAAWNGSNYINSTQIPYSSSSSNNDPKKVVFLGGNANVIAVKSDLNMFIKYSLFNGISYTTFVNVSNSPIPYDTRIFISDTSFNIYSVITDPEIYSSTYSFTYGNILGLDASFNSTLYSVNTLVKGTSYTAQLKAGNADGESATTSVGFTTLSQPNPPTNIIFNALGNTQITFSFTPPSGTVTRYDVSAISQTQTVSATFSPPLTSYQLTGLQGATTYTIFLYAVNIYGRSFPLVGTTATLLIPDSVTNLTATPVSDTSIQLNYTPPSQTVNYYSLTYAKTIPDTSFNVSFANSSTVATSANDILGLTITQPNNTRLAVFASFAGVRYSRITNNSWGTYSTPTVSYSPTPNGTNVNGIAMLSDASRLVCSFGTYGSANNWIYFANPTNLYNGTSTSLSFTRILDTTQRIYYALALTSNGSRLVVAVNAGTVYFSTWNGTNYSAFTQTLDTTTRNHTGLCISPDGNKIAYCANNLVYWAVWNGTNYTNGTQILGGSSNGTDSRKVSFLGADTNFIVLTPWDGINQYTTWNGTNYAALTNIPTSALPNTNGWGLFVDTSGNTANIYLSPYANSNVYRSVLTFSKSSNTVTVSGSSTAYTIELLSKNTAYDISFVTVNSYGSSFPALTSATTLNTVEPVTGVSTSVTNTTATISFNAPPQTITYYSTTIDASGFIYTKTYNTTSVSFVGLVPSRTYSYNISAFGTDSSSNVTSTFTTPTIPTAPTTPVFIAESPYAIDVSFGLIEQSLPTIFFNGSTQVAASSASDANFNTGTVECWFRTSANNPSAAGIIVKPSAYSIYLNNNVLSAYDWTASAWRSTGYTLNNNVWYHVAFTFQSGVANGSNIYLNGDLLSTFTYTPQAQTSALYFGSAGGFQYYTGYISEVRIWNAVRTASQIAMYYNKKLPASETGLIGYFPMVESAGSIIYNALRTGGIANFTLSNTSQWTTDTIDIIDLSNIRYTLTATPSSGTTVTSTLTKLYGSVGGLVPNTAYTVTVGRVTSTGTSSASSGLAVTTDATSSYIEPDNLLTQNTNVLYAANLFTSSSINVNGQTPIYRNGTYITSASATLNNDLGNYGFYRAFNLVNATTNAGWLGASVYNSSNGAYIGSATTTDIVSSSNISGEWIQIQLPYRIVLKSVGLMPRQLGFPGTISNMPVSMVIVGSNNGTTWNIIYTNTNATYSSSSLTVTTFTITGATTPYSYIRLIARTVGLANSVAIQQLNYNGDIYLSTLIIPPYPLLTSEVTTTGATVSMYRTVDINNAVYYYKLNGYGGDAITNVSSTTINTLSVSATNVLYGSGLFTSDTITVSGQTPTYRNGAYTTSASSVLNFTNNAVNDNVSFGAFRAFNLSTSTANTGAYWHSADAVYSSGTYIGTATTANIASSSNIAGEWIQIQLPYRIVLKSVGLMPRQSVFPTHIPRMPVSMVIVGSNDGTNWNIIYTNTNASYSSSSATVTTFTITGATTPYSYIRLIARTVGNTSVVNIEQLNYNGDIYTVSSGFNTSSLAYNYASGAGVVDASLVNNPQFGVTSGYNEIRLNSASSQYVQLPSFTNNANGLTISCWFRANATSNFSRICDFATAAEGVNDIFIAVNTNDLCYRIAGITIYYNVTSSNINTNVYYHLAFVLSARSGSTCTVTVYLNNVLKYTGTNITYPALLTRTICSIGKSSYASNATFNGAVNNFFMWNRPLSTTEISALYSTSVVSSTYRIYAVSLTPRNNNVISSTVATTSSTISSAITGLSSGQPYALYATNITNTESSPSSVLYLTVPGPAPTLTLSSYTNTTATFTITPNLSYFILSFTITVTNVVDGSTGTKIIQTVSSATTSTTISGLTQNTSYTATVVANTRTVDSAISNVISFTTDGPPVAPTGFTVETAYSNNLNSNILTTSFTKYSGGVNNAPTSYFISGRSRTSDVSSITFATNSTLVSTASTDHLSLAMSAPGATRLALLAGLTGLQAYRIVNGSWGSVINVTVTGITFVDFVACAITSDGTRAVIIHGTNGGNTLIYHTNTTNLLGGSSTTLALTQTLETTTRGYRCVTLTKDGSRLVCGVLNSFLYLATWNGTNYSALSALPFGLPAPTRFNSSIAISGDSQILAYATKSMLHWRVWNGTTYADEKYALMTSSSDEIAAVSFMGDSSNVLMYTTTTTAGYVYWNGSNYAGLTSIPTTAIASGNNRGFVIDTSTNIYIYRNGAASITTSSVSSISYAAASTFTKTLTANRFVDTSNILMYYKLNGTGHFDQYLFNYKSSPLVSDASFVGNPTFGITSGYSEIQLVATSSQHVQLQSFTIGTSGLTVAFWFRANSSGNWSRCFEFAGSANGINSIFLSINSNNLNYVVTNSSGAVSTIVIQTNINDNVYRHFVFVIGPQSGSTCNITGYINGSVVYTGTNLAYPPIVTRSVNYIGRSSYVADPYFNGGIFDFFVWNRAIAASEVTNLYNNPNTDFTPITNITSISNYKIYDISINAMNAYGTSAISTTNYTFGANSGTRVTNTAFNLYRFTTSGAITIPGAKTVYMVIVGGGGNGANTNATYWNYNAAGGGGGGMRTIPITQTTTTTYYIDVGPATDTAGTDPTQVIGGNPSRVYYGTTMTGANGGFGASLRTSTTSAPGGTAGTLTSDIKSVSGFSLTGTPGTGGTVNTNPTSGVTVTIGATTYTLCGGGGGATNTSTGQMASGGGYAATSVAEPSDGGTNTGGGGGGQKAWTSSTAVRNGGGRGGSGVVLVFYK